MVNNMWPLLNQYYIKPCEDYQKWLMSEMLKQYYPHIMMQGFMDGGLIHRLY